MIAVRSLFVIALGASSLHAQYTLGTTAGGGPNNISALTADIAPTSVAADGAGNFYYTEGNRILKIDTNGTLTVFAGNGGTDKLGDGGLAINATFVNPTGLAIDGQNNLYVADRGNHRVRIINLSSSNIATFAGMGTAGFTGDGGAATASQLSSPGGVAADRSTNKIFIADSGNFRVRVVSSGIINTFAGNGGFTYAGDGGPATSLSLYSPGPIAVDPGKYIYICQDSSAGLGDNRVLRITAAGTNVQTLADQTGAAGFSGDGGPSPFALLNGPRGLAVTSNGDIFVSDSGNNRVRRITYLGGISPFIGTYAGTGAAGVTQPPGDGALSTNGSVTTPGALAVTPDGDILIAEPFRVRAIRITRGSILETVAGNRRDRELAGIAGNYSGEGGGAIDAVFKSPRGVAVDLQRRVVFADRDNQRIFRVEANIVTTIAGTGKRGSEGDGGAATAANLSDPEAIAIDSKGSIYVVNTGAYKIRKIDASTGKISTYAGTGVQGQTGDGGAATSATLTSATSIAFDSADNLYIADNTRIRKITASTGVITTLFGMPQEPADTPADYFRGVAVKADGTEVYASLFSRVLIWRNGASSTWAGSRDSQSFVNAADPDTTYSADAPANNIHVRPRRMVLDSQGYLFWIETTNGHTIRRGLPASGVSPILTQAGAVEKYDQGVRGYVGDGPSGDGVAAPLAGINALHLAADNARIFFSDSNGRVRFLSGTPCSFDGPSPVQGVPAEGGILSVPIFTANNCAWEIALNFPGASVINNTWFPINPLIPQGRSSSTVLVSIPPNTTGAPRAGSLLIAGNQMGIAQTAAGSNCISQIAPASFSFPADSSIAYVTIYAPGSCPWTVTGLPTWITANFTSGSGFGTIALTAALNAGAARSASFTIAGVATQADQAASNCAFTLDRYREAPGQAGGAFSITLTTANGCPWLASSGVSWITVSTPSSGQGASTVGIAVAPNNSGQTRTGILSIGGQTFTVQQGTGACTYFLSRALVPLSASSGSTQIDMTTGTGCAWSAVSNASWLTASGAATGSGTLTVSYAANTGAYREAIMTAGGQPIPVEQASSSLNPPDFSAVTPFSGSGATQTFTFSMRDADGWADIASIRVNFNVALAPTNACLFRYDPATNRLFLADDTGAETAALQGGLGASMTLANQQCSIDLSRTTFSLGGDTLALTVPVTFSGFFAGRRLVYVYASDSAGRVFDYVAAGTWWTDGSAGTAVPRYRLFNPFSRTHLHTTDLNEYLTLGPRGFTQEGVDSRILSAPATRSGVAAAPYYRLYSPPGISHFWTSDRNEYLTLMRFRTAWVAEGVDGFILPSRTPSTIPLYRLLFCCNTPPIHHFTPDSNEFNVLSTRGDWSSEGIVGYVYPPSGSIPSALPGLTVLHAATSEAGPVAPGQLIRVSGESLDGLSLDGVPLEVIGAEGREVIARVPESATGKDSVTLTAGGMSAILAVTPSRPGIFAADFFGRGRAKGGDAARGGLLTILVTGDGGAPLSATIGGLPADVVGRRFADRPGYTALTLRVPAELESGEAEVIVSSGAWRSQAGVSVAVR